MRGIGRDPTQQQLGQLVDSLLARHVEPNLIQPTFLIDYPLTSARSPKATWTTRCRRFEG